MKLVRTTITPTHCEMRYADAEQDADVWVDVRVRLPDLKYESKTTLPDPKGLHLAATQIAILRYLQTLATDEMARLAPNLPVRNSASSQTR
jgi:hypothetical protein